MNKRMNRQYFALCSLTFALLTISGPLGSGLGYKGLTIAPVYGQTARVDRGYDLLAKGRVNDAIAVFQELVRQNPKDLEALTGLVIAYRRAGRDSDAFATHQRILVLDPDNRLSLSTLGLLGEFRPEWQPIGIQALTRLLQLEPTSLEARAQRAKLYYFQGLFSQSLADYALVLPKTSDLNIVGPAAEAHTFSGDYATGLALFDRYRSTGGVISGDRSIAYAQALRDSGQVAAAIQVLEQELGKFTGQELSTQQIRLIGALASTYAANRQFQEVLAIIQPLRGRTDSRLTLARALSALGDYSQQVGYSQEAANLYIEVLRTTPHLTPGGRREASFVLGSLPEHRSLALQLVNQLAEEQPEEASLTLQQRILAYQIGQINRSDFVQRVRTSFPSLPSDPVQVRYMGQVLSRLDPPPPELLPLYQSLVAGGATEPFLSFRIAQIFTQQGRLGEAQMALASYANTPAGRRDPETVQLMRADLERRQGNLAQSIQAYQELLATAQLPLIRAGAVQGLAAVYQIQGRFGEALALYDQLIAANPQNLAYPLGRAALAYQAGLITETEASALLSQGMQRYAGSTPPQELITLATVLPPSPSRAELYRSLLAINPGNPQLQLRALQVLASTNPAQAEAQAAQLVATNPAVLDWYFVQGEIAQQTGNYPLARQSYEAILARQPNNFDAQLALAGLEFQLGNYDRAESLYKAILASDSNNAIARTSLAALNAVQGYPLAALRQLQAFQQEFATVGMSNPQINREIQQIQEGLLLQRGFRLPWESF